MKEEQGDINLILASPECTSHSVARGNKIQSEESMDTTWQIIRFAKVFEPRWIVIENVLQMQRWSAYGDFLRKLKDQGYYIRKQKLIASDFGIPQSRKRLFILCDRQKKPAMVLPVSNAKRQLAIDIVELNGLYKCSLLKTKQRAEATIKRAERAIAAIGPQKPFLIVYYSSDGPGGWQPLDVPLRTVTTVDWFALVKTGRNGHVMRMLQVGELKAAMGFPDEFKIDHGIRREKIRMLGNAVCPPVMEAIIRSLT